MLPVWQRASPLELRGAIRLPMQSCSWIARLSLCSQHRVQPCAASRATDSIEALIAFTHFDQVRETTCAPEPTRASSLASLDNTIVALARSRRSTENALKRIAPNGVFFVESSGDRSRTAREREPSTERGLCALLKAHRRSEHAAPPPEVTPVYDEANLIIAFSEQSPSFASHGPGSVTAITRRFADIGLASRR